MGYIIGGLALGRRLMVYQIEGFGIGITMISYYIGAYKGVT